MRTILGTSLGLLLALLAGKARAQDYSWHPGGVRLLPPMQTMDSPATSPPVVRLGRPEPIQATGDWQSVRSGYGETQIQRTAYDPIVRAQNTDYPPPPPAALPGPPGGPPAGSPTEPYNCAVATEPASGTGFWDKCRHAFDGFPGFSKDTFASGSRHLFESDHAFDRFSSPVTNPLLFEDPRSLTELRPIFMYQETGIKNPIFHGGDIEYFGLQGRLAITERLSLVMSEFGFIAMEPHNGTPDFQSHTGLAELRIGPKYTFLRNETTNTLGAFGVNFDIPWGDRKVLQDTGSLTIEPYLSMGQSFGHTRYGTFDALGTIGYNFATDNKRSDNLFTSLHLDFDVGDFHRIYPFVELHWFYYTANGKAHPALAFEGRDLFDFGSGHVAGHSEVSIALGGRFKLNDCWQFGLGVEVPLTGNRDLQAYRVTADLIFRY